VARLTLSRRDEDLALRAASLLRAKSGPVADEGSLSVHGSRVKRGSGFDGWDCLMVGWCVGLVGARGVVRAGAQPYLGPRSGWFRVGDMMVDGVIPRG